MVAMADAKLNGSGKETSIRSIIVVEDAEDIADSIRYNLAHEGFLVRVASSGQAALDLILDRPPNLILLDVNLPGMSGFELCRRLREESATARVPILMLTARSGESDKVLGLELGADDYLTKPFSMRELLARVNAILRRADGPAPEQPVYDDGVLVIDPWTFSVRYEGREVRLTRKEMRLLEELARNEGRVMMREVLLDRIWGLRYYGDSRTLDVHIRRLRMKLGNPNLIETITGIGYRLIGSRAKQE
jgi:two-component system, OmpR family, alkaline phosphatase synthesis response regulator PhoP